MRRIATFVFLLTCFSGYHEAKAQGFSEVSVQSGINHLGKSLVKMGGGCALFDYDNDGYLDAYITGGSVRDHLYHNNQDGTFTEVGTQAGLSSVNNFFTMGVIAGDIDNDGYKDLLVTTWGDYQMIGYHQVTRNILLRNNGNGTFTDISISAGIIHGAWSFSASFGDYNLDGFLDIYIGNYVDSPDLIRDSLNEIVGFAHVGYKNFFYINNGDNTFSEISAQLGINDQGTALATTFTDYDNDSDPDIYVANDFGEWVIPNVLYRNEFPLDSFTNVSQPSGANAGIYGMGIAIGDYDEDQDLDYYVTNIGRNVLYSNQGNGTFLDVTDSAGVANTYVDSLFSTSWGANFLDYDNDTYLDLFVSNGEIPAADFIATHPNDPNKLFKNNSDGTFTDVSLGAGISDSTIGRGSVYGDYDNDGDLDILVVVIDKDTSSTAHTLLYRNETTAGNHWLKVKLQGIEANRDGYGTRLVLHTNGRKFIREIDGGSSHASSNSSIGHFGLGNYTSIDSLEVLWPGGKRQVLYNLPIDQLVTVVESIIDTVIIHVQVYICMGDSTFAGGAWQNQPGVYHDTLAATSGPDTVKITQLSVIQPVISILDQRLCPGESMTVGNSTYSSSGIYRDTLGAVSGCDSIVLTTISALAVSYTSLNFSICAGDSLVIKNLVYDQAGLYYDTLTAINGCDSIVEINLEVVQPTIANRDTSICAGDSIFIGGAFQTTAGSYIDTLINNKGCDSILTTYLSVTEINIEADSTLICAGDSAVLVAPGGYDSYLWLPNNEFTQSIAAGPGVYELIVTYNNCTGTTDFIVESDTVAVHFEEDSISVYPGDTVQLDPVIADAGIQNLIYLWTPSASLSCGDCPHPFATPIVTTCYGISVINENACSASATICLDIIDTITSISPTAIYAFNIFPNPTNAGLTLFYYLPEHQQTAISLLSIDGKEIGIILNEMQPSGYHEIFWNFQELSSGIYLLRLKTNGTSIYKKCILLDH